MFGIVLLFFSRALVFRLRIEVGKVKFRVYGKGQTLGRRKLLLRLPEFFWILSEFSSQSTIQKR